MAGFKRRTMIASFHHFLPQIAREILHNEFQDQRTICIFAGFIADSIRHPLHVAHSLVRSSAHAKGQAHVLASGRAYVWAADLAFTQLFGLVFVSNLRTYSVCELKELIRGIVSSEYQWEIGSIEIPGFLMNDFRDGFGVVGSGQINDQNLLLRW
ncbi:MAG: hypothetical protein ABSG96_10735 [Terracidiphilus sp.]